MQIIAGPSARRVSGISLYLLLLCIPAWQVSAQGAVASLQHLEVALWPEFDRPAMLVIYRFELPPEVNAPTTVELPIPIEVGEPHAVAWQDASGALFDAPFELISEGMVLISIPQGSRGQLEYYADLSIDEQLRSFRFEWPGTLPLDGFSYEVQQPAGAGQLSVAPGPDRQAVGPFGLTYASADLGPQPAGSELVIEVSYRKSGSGLSLPPPSEALAPSEATAPTSADLLPYLLAGGGVLLIVAGVIYYTRGRTRPTSRKPASARPSGQAELELSTVFCHQCGTKATVNDRYCRNCGARLRN